MWKGRPDDEFFDQPISHSDHPFLKQYAHADMVRNSRGELVQSSEAKSAERRPGESELDYFDRRYKERVNGLKFRIFWIGFKRKKEYYWAVLYFSKKLKGRQSQSRYRRVHTMTMLTFLLVCVVKENNSKEPFS